MKILVINCGSSSLKYQLFDMDNEEVLVKGLVERIGIDGSRLKQEKGDDEYIIEEDMKDHTEAVKHVFDAITDKENGVISDLSEIDAVGHRFVHGGEKITKSVVIDDEVKEAVKEYSKFAPLHNPANMMGLEACEKLLPNVKNVAVFDTAFHQSMPEENFLYGIDYKYYEDQAVRKYGFHGTSHLYVSGIMREIMGNPEHSKIIVCHLGNGASITAVKDGKSIDTSMGLTPLQGLMMGTRCGDIDPAAVLFVKNKRGLTDAQMDDRMNKKSGILGLFGKSSDCRDMENAVKEGDERAILAESVSMHRLRSYIGAYAAVMGGVDAICFTGGIGENSSMTREKALEGLEFLGVELDKEINSVRKKGNVKLSKETSKVLVYKIPTNEELVIARDTFRLAK